MTSYFAGSGSNSEIMTTWDMYLRESLLSPKILDKALIAGHDGNIWARSDDFNITPLEMRSIIDGFKNPALFTLDGVTINGKRYIYLSGSDRILRAKRSSCGVHAMKTNMAMIICTYESPTQPQQAAIIVEKFGDFLLSCGY